MTTAMVRWRQAWYRAHVHRVRHFQSLYFPRAALRPGCHSQSGCQHSCFCTTEQPANGAKVGAREIHPSQGQRLEHDCRR